MNAAQTERVKQEIGKPVPNIKLPSLNGTTHELDSLMQGKRGAVVLFWSETCSHCERYDSYFNSFEERHPELGLVAVASRQGEGLNQVRSTAAARNLSFPILYDAGGQVARQWFTVLTPRVFLLDRNRNLLYRGAIDNFTFPGDPDHVAYLEPAIESFLAGKPIERPETTNFGCELYSVYYALSKPFA
jgi:peroxiredoxin